MNSPPHRTGPSRSDQSGRWQARLTGLAARHRVPGASLGILRVPADGSPDDLVQAACGYANFPAGIEATTDTLFQIGSITKVWTATLALQLADEGRDWRAPARSSRSAPAGPTATPASCSPAGSSSSSPG